MPTPPLDRELEKGSAELIILSIGTWKAFVRAMELITGKGHV